MIVPKVSAVSVAIACRALELPRATYYRARQPEVEAEIELRDAVQQIALEWPGYGYRRNHGGTPPARPSGEPQARAAADARR
jgi:hypothetical protein